MIFKKKKKMVDLRELQRRGVVRIPKKDAVIPTNEEGFVDFRKESKQALQNPIPQPKSDSNLIGFMDSSSSFSQQSSSEDPYTKRETDSKIVELDNKIYKLEQRIELLERKLGINQPEDSSVGPLGW